MFVRPVLPGIVEIHVHLPGIRMREFSKLQIDNDEAAQLSMKEEQIDSIPFVADAQPTLARDECEVTAEFDQEAFETTNQRLFQFRFRVFIFQAKEFEGEGIFDFSFSAQIITRLRLGLHYFVGQCGRVIQFSVDSKLMGLK